MLDALAQSEQAVRPTCRDLGIGFVPWSPLGVGFLTGAIDANTRFADGDIRTQMAHMLENIGAASIRFTAAEAAELDAAVREFQVRGKRLPDAVQVFSGVEAPTESR